MMHRLRIVPQRRRANDVDDDGDREGKENGRKYLLRGKKERTGWRNNEGERIHEAKNDRRRKEKENDEINICV